MDSISVLLNGKPVEFFDDYNIIRKLEKDDSSLILYVYDKLKEGRVDFLSNEDISSVDISRCSSVNRFEKSSLSVSGDAEKTSDEEIQNEEDCIGESRSVWSHRGKPTQDDDEATRLMLEIRGSETFKSKFKDKKSVKMNLWRDIATFLSESGFHVDGERCRQKFANLQKLYINFVRHTSQTGGEKRDPPKYYGLLHLILGSQDKVNLHDVEDTLDLPKENTENEVRTQDLEKGKEIVKASSSKEQTRQSKVQVKAEKPQRISKQDILMEIRTQGMKQDEHMSKFCSLIEEQNKQRTKLIGLFRIMAGKENENKRMHSSDLLFSHNMN